MRSTADRESLQRFHLDLKVEKTFVNEESKGNEIKFQVEKQGRKNMSCSKK